MRLLYIKLLLSISSGAALEHQLEYRMIQSHWTSVATLAYSPSLASDPSHPISPPPPSPPSPPLHPSTQQQFELGLLNELGYLTFTTCNSTQIPILTENKPGINIKLDEANSGVKNNDISFYPTFSTCTAYRLNTCYRFSDCLFSKFDKLTAEAVCAESFMYTLSPSLSLTTADAYINPIYSITAYFNSRCTADENQFYVVYSPINPGECVAGFGVNPSTELAVYVNYSSSPTDSCPLSIPVDSKSPKSSPKSYVDDDDIDDQRSLVPMSPYQSSTPLLERSNSMNNLTLAAGFITFGPCYDPDNYGCQQLNNCFQAGPGQYETFQVQIYGEIMVGESFVYSDSGCRNLVTGTGSSFVFGPLEYDGIESLGGLLFCLGYQPPSPSPSLNSCENQKKYINDFLQIANTKMYSRGPKSANINFKQDSSITATGIIVILAFSSACILLLIAWRSNICTGSGKTTQTTSLKEEDGEMIVLVDDSLRRPVIETLSSCRDHGAEGHYSSITSAIGSGRV